MCRFVLDCIVIMMVLYTLTALTFAIFNGDNTLIANTGTGWWRTLFTGIGFIAVCETVERKSNEKNV